MRNNFQYIIFGVFGVAIVVAMLLFALNIDLKEGDNTLAGAKGSVEIWGILPAQTVRTYTDQIATTDLKITYRQIDTEGFDTEVVEAWAAGEGPDMILADHETILEHDNKLFHIPYTSFPEANYRAAYVNIADLFLASDGIIAFPLLVDPIVTYYNRDILSAEFIVTPPSTWEEIQNMASVLTEVGETGTILRSAVALGTPNNINHSKDILAGIIMQKGNNIVGRGNAGELTSLVFYDLNFGEVTEEAIERYASFAAPENEYYSWNESLPLDRSAFLFGDLAMYFGYASEISSLRAQNPNLNFSLTLFPQFEQAPTKITFGRMHALAISKLSRNIPSSILVASEMSREDIAEGLYNELLVPPARKNILSNTSGLSAEETTLFRSAIIARAWYDPDQAVTDIFFANMIKNIRNGMVDIGGAVSRLHSDMSALLRDN